MTKPCINCIGDAQHNVALINEGNVLIYLDRDLLMFEGYDPHGDYEDASVDITYCPKCGRKLEAKP